jgi:hypothetical protein
MNQCMTVLDEVDRAAEVFEASSRDNSVAVYVGVGGACLGVRLEDRALPSTESKLATHIMLLSAYGQLRAQLVLRRVMAAGHADVFGMATADQVAQFETLIDF